MTRLSEIADIASLNEVLDRAGSGDGLVLQGIDLRPMADRITATTWSGAVFLGCRIDLDAVTHVIDTGGAVFPRFAGLPYQPFRAALYTLDELMAGYDRSADSPLAATLDGAIYAHQVDFRNRGQALPVVEALAQRIHDHAIDDAIHELLAGHPRVVAVMGGHSMHRDDPAFADVARLGRMLAQRDYFVVTGGGPGAMEAANLGAWMADRSQADLDAAIELLAPHVDYTTAEYLAVGYEVLERWPDGRDSLAIPTWFYGHEPTNQFASHIAKYFANSIREDGLLSIASHGIVYAPGAAGTVQEVFQEATQNHYGVFGNVSPMVLLGIDHWSAGGRLPVMPLLEALAGDRQYASMITCTDDVAAAVDFLDQHPPVPYR